MTTITEADVEQAALSWLNNDQSSMNAAQRNSRKTEEEATTGYEAELGTYLGR